MIEELLKLLEWVLNDLKQKQAFGDHSPELKKALDLQKQLEQYRGGAIISNDFQQVLIEIANVMIVTPDFHKLGEALNKFMKLEGLIE